MIYKTPYAEYDVVVIFERYQNNRIAIELVDKNDGEPICMATVNIPEAPLADNEIIIKNYSENEGVLEFLQKNSYVGKTLRMVQAGYAKANVVNLLKSE